QEKEVALERIAHACRYRGGATDHALRLLDREQPVSRDRRLTTRHGVHRRRQSKRLPIARRDDVGFREWTHRVPCTCEPSVAPPIGNRNGYVAPVHRREQ